jgi:putative nucleotidyltransferase with HDIG domain|tara:strand:- start:52583 stop:55090 length:2508 start_codon:yes stop_codon:yes gene_type:complete
MANNRKSRKDTVVATRRKRESVLGEVARRKFEPSLWVNAFLFGVFGISISFLAFFGLSPASPLLQKGQVSRVRVIAEVPFNYQSDIETQRARAKRAATAPPVYTLDQSTAEDFRSYLLDLHKNLTEFADIPDGAERSRYALRAEELRLFFQDYAAENPYGLRVSDLVVIFNQLPRAIRENTLREGLLELDRLYRTGIYPEDSVRTLPTQNLRIFQIQNNAGEIEEVNLITEEEALRSLRIQLAAFDIPRESSIALFRIFREGLQPNLNFDEERTQALQQKYISEVQPVIISVDEGTTIVEPNAKVNQAALEKLSAYQSILQQSESATFGFDALFRERTILTLSFIFCLLIYLKLSGVRLTANRRTILLAGSALLLNLFIYRLIIEVGGTETAQRNPILLALIPYLLPVALAPMLISMLLGVGSGVICAALLALLNGLMQGNSISICVASFSVSLLGIVFSRNLKVRTRVVRAGLFSGMVMALSAALFGLRDSMEPLTVIYQMLTAIGIGTLTGIALIGFLPIWEGLFKTTTDITLLELTDFNHPLLRRLQVEAPGSYHHSLMVANLSENGAAAIGANPLVCRVCSLFHDIGKLVKPEYFTENQRDGYNPHIERNPSMSALVIKSHVKEGAVLAKEYKLPKIVIDAINQHHGTSLIQYFYYKALERNRLAKTDGIHDNQLVPSIELDKVNEATYRYEGPRPQFTESALIMLADSVEAAGRSLPKVTPQSIDELIEKIFRSRIEDGQLDESPLTFQQLSKIQESFSFTLLNMLHARIEYPKEEAIEAATRKERRNKKGSRAPFAELGERLDPALEEDGAKKEKTAAEESKSSDAPSN